MSNGCWLSGVDFPSALWAKIASQSPLQRDDVMDAMTAHRALHTRATQMQAKIHELESQCRRLESENRFLTRVVNELDA
jgi:hypothetical protein